MLIHRDESCLIVVDIQERLLPAMTAPEQVAGNAAVLIEAAKRLQVPILVSEQYPRGLGHTVAAVAEMLPARAPVIEKSTFSCMSSDQFVDTFRDTKRRQAIVAGIEAHVCVLQTAEQLVASGLNVFVVADATASRTPVSHQVAMARLAAAGAHIVTTEMVVFEWLGRSGTAEFKELSALIK